MKKIIIILVVTSGLLVIAEGYTIQEKAFKEYKEYNQMMNFTECDSLFGN